MPEATSVETNSEDKEHLQFAIADTLKQEPNGMLERSQSYQKNTAWRAYQNRPEVQGRGLKCSRIRPGPVTAEATEKGGARGRLVPEN